MWWLFSSSMLFSIAFTPEKLSDASCFYIDEYGEQNKL